MEPFNTPSPLPDPYGQLTPTALPPLVNRD